jgi:beta-lactam-binding protein with PASTA domain
MNKLTSRTQRHPILRNIILAVCAIVVFLFVVNLLLNLFTRHNSYKAVPDFSALTLDEAKAAARKASLNIEVSDSLYVPAYPGGVVLTQLPEPGTNVKSGRRIFLTINSFRQKMVTIPYVTGFSLRQAKNNLEVAGLEIEKIIYRSDMATNNILETRYKDQLITRGSNVQAEQGSGVTLVAGMSGDETTTVVPKVTGFPYKEAKGRLWEAGLNVGDIVFDKGITLMERNDARVYSQWPEQGSRVTLGTVASIKLTIEEQKVDEGSASSNRAARRIVATQDAEEQAATQEDTEQEADDEDGL